MPTKGRPPHPLGFLYAEAVRDLNRRMTWEEIANELGFESDASVRNIAEGTIPLHPQGEAIWYLYKRVFGKKPPMTPEQTDGYLDEKQEPKIRTKGDKSS